MVWFALSADLNLLPLMYIYELNDVMFLIKSLNMPTGTLTSESTSFLITTQLDLGVT